MSARQRRALSAGGAGAGVSHGFMLGDGDGGDLTFDGGPLNPARRATFRQAQYILDITGQPPLTDCPWGNPKL